MGRRRRAERESHHSCCATPTATACRDPQRVPQGPQFAVRHGAGRQRPLRREHRCDLALPLYATGDTQIIAAGHEGRRPAGRPDQPSLDQEPDREPRRHSACMSTVGSNSNVAEHGMENEERRAAILEIDRGDRPVARVRLRPAQSERPRLAAADRRALDRGQRARRTRQRSRARLPHLGEGRRLLRMAVSATTDSTSTARRSRSAPTWWRKRSCPTMRSASHTASLGLTFYHGRSAAGSAITAARSSGSTARGIASPAAATR